MRDRPSAGPPCSPGRPSLDLTAELADLGVPAGTEWTHELLTFNPKNAITEGIWRVRAGTWTAVLKVLTRRRQTEAQWAASTDPRHWNYWRREADAYESGLTDVWAADGVRGPRLLRRVERPGGEIALWLEDVQGTAGASGGVADFANAAHRLGRGQGRSALEPRRWSHPWTSENFLGGYIASKRVDWALLDDPDAWAQPLVREHFPASLRKQMRALHADRARFVGVMSKLPRVLCHLDLWPHNMIFARSGDVVLLDWAFVGEGALGEDIGNLIPDSVFDLFLPASQLPELESAVVDGYLAGLHEAGWRGDPDLVRLGMWASAVKYDWLTPLMLERASLERQLDYGEQAVVDVDTRYHERGATLAFLGGWADNARRLLQQRPELDRQVG